MTDKCASCSRTAVTSSASIGGCIYRFLPVSDKDVVLFCKSCADKVHNFVRGMIRS